MAAVVDWTPVPFSSGHGPHGYALYTVDLASGDSTTPMLVTGAVATVQLAAVSGATVTAQGSLEEITPTLWGTMKDTSGTAISLTTAPSAPVTVQPETNFLRVLSTGGTSTVKLAIRHRPRL